MARLNVYVTDQFADALKRQRDELGESVSRICSDALQLRLNDIAEAMKPINAISTFAAQMPSGLEATAQAFERFDMRLSETAAAIGQPIQDQHREALAEALQALSRIPADVLGQAREVANQMSASDFLDAAHQVNVERERALGESARDGTGPGRALMEFIKAPSEAELLRDEIGELRAELRDLRDELRRPKGSE